MLSHQAYPPIPLPVNVPPGHMMQQIVDENGILKHIIIGPNNPNEPMPKNQILTKNGAKLVPLNFSSPAPAAKLSTSSSFKKKFSQSTGGDAYKSSRYPNGLAGSDALLNGSSGLLSSNGLVYSSLCYYCCPQCPECVPNQLNSSSNSLFLNNELNYARPVSYFSSSVPTSGKSAAAAANTTNYPGRRSFNLGSSSSGRAANNTSSNLTTATHSGALSNGYGKESSREKSKPATSKSSANACANNPNCNLNYSSSSYQPKGALLSTSKVCKQCPPPESGYSTTTSYNQKYLYPAPSYTSFSSSHHNQQNGGLYQATSSNKKYSYASSSEPKQSPTNRNRALSSNTSRAGGQLINQPPLLNGNGLSSAHSTSKKESDCYSELIRYVNSNHISAFKSHKRIEHSKAHQASNGQAEKAHSNSVTASSSPISEHYDFSSEESEQTTYKHTTLLSNPPTNYHPSNGYPNGYSSASYSSSAYSTNHSNNSLDSTANSNGYANRKPVRVKRSSNECSRPAVQEKSEALTKSAIEKCNNLKNEQQNDERDDGFEGDDFELKNCDNKSNDEVLLATEEVAISEQPVVNDVETNKTVVEDAGDQAAAADQSDPVNCEPICEETGEDEQVLSDQPPNEAICEESGKRILDENSNEIDRVDQNLIIPEIVESLATDKPDEEQPLGYFNELNVEELNNNSSLEKDKNERPDELAIEQSGAEEAVNKADSDEKPISKPSIRRKSEIVRTVVFSLSYTKLTANYVKLKWTVLNGALYATAKESQFMVEMIYAKRDESQSSLGGQSSPSAKCSRIVYQGLSKCCKIQCLRPLEEYSFRVKIVLPNEQLVSNLLTITTPELQIQPLNHFIGSGKKRTSKHNLQLNLQQEILKQQQIIIEQKEKELQLKQSQFHNQPPASPSSLVVLFCAIGTLFKENFAYLLLIFFFISAFSFANFISDLLN